MEGWLRGRALSRPIPEPTGSCDDRTDTGARNAASSASPASRARPNWPAWRCTPCSTAARRAPASPSRDGHRLIRPTRRWAWWPTSSTRHDRRVADRATTPSATCATAPPAAATSSTPSRSRWPATAARVSLAHNGNLVNAPRAAPGDGAGRLHLLHHQRQRGDPAPAGAQPGRHRGATPLQEVLPRVRGRLQPGGADPRHADRRARSPRLPAPLPGPLPGQLRGRQRELRLRHHRRALPARHRAGRDGRPRRRASWSAAAWPSRTRRAALRLRARLLLAARQPRSSAAASSAARRAQRRDPGPRGARSTADLVMRRARLAATPPPWATPGPRASPSSWR